MMNLIIFITGFCSMIYELGLAQLLTSLLGSTIIRYSTALAVYVITMGLGSFFFKDRTVDKNLKMLIQVELAMTFLGLLAAPFFIFSNAILNSLFSESLSNSLLIYLTHIYIGLCGFICGYEIPILGNLLAVQQGRRSEAWVLSWDYIGMFAASILFPFFMLPFLGIFSSLWVTSLLNFICVFLLFQKQSKKSHIAYMGFMVLLLVHGFLIVKSKTLGDFFSEIYLQGF